jgi:hypothetical protein
MSETQSGRSPPLEKRKAAVKAAFPATVSSRT